MGTHILMISIIIFDILSVLSADDVTVINTRVLAPHASSAAATTEGHHERVGNRRGSAEESRERLETRLEKRFTGRGRRFPKNTGKHATYWPKHHTSAFLFSIYTPDTQNHHHNSVCGNSGFQNLAGSS